jgi:hypothetical protein
MYLLVERLPNRLCVQGGRLAGFGASSPPPRHGIRREHEWLARSARATPPGTRRAGRSRTGSPAGPMTSRCRSTRMGARAGTPTPGGSAGWPGALVSGRGSAVSCRVMSGPFGAPGPAPTPRTRRLRCPGRTRPRTGPVATSRRAKRLRVPSRGRIIPFPRRPALRVRGWGTVAGDRGHAGMSGRGGVLAHLRAAVLHSRTQALSPDPLAC